MMRPRNSLAEPSRTRHFGQIKEDKHQAGLLHGARGTQGPPPLFARPASPLAASPLPKGMVIEQKVERRDSSPKPGLALRPISDQRLNRCRLTNTTTTPLHRRRPATQSPPNPQIDRGTGDPRRPWSLQDDLKHASDKDFLHHRCKASPRRVLLSRATPLHPFLSTMPSPEKASRAVR
jgi:hypothetical protein